MSNNNQHDNKELFEKMFDNVLDEALVKMAGTPNPNLPDDASVKFSDEHNKKIDQIFERAKAEKRKSVFRISIKRIAICAAILVLLFCITVMSVGAVRSRIMEFIFEYNNIFTRSTNSTNYNESYETDKFVLNYLPNGFVINDAFEADNLTRSEFINNNDRFVVVVRLYGDDNILDTENSDIEHVTINGIDGYYISNNKGNMLVLYYDDYLCIINGSILKEELVKIAHNLEIK